MRHKLPQCQNNQMEIDNGTPAAADENEQFRRLNEALAELDKLPPEEVADLIRASGLLDVALSTIAHIARHSQDPTARANALRAIKNNGLELLLFPDEG